MADIKNLLSNVRKDFNTMNHRRNAYSISHPYAIAPAPSPLPRSSTAVFQRPMTAQTPIFDDASDDGTELQEGRLHTGTATCGCSRCLLPGKLSFAEFKHHVTTKIEAGKRELDSIDDQLAHCRDLMKTLLELEDHAARLTAEAEAAVPADSALDDAWLAATTPSSPELEDDFAYSDDALAPLLEESSPSKSRRHTIVGLPSFSSTSSARQVARPQMSYNVNQSFNSDAPSSFYSQASVGEEAQALVLPQSLAVPPRASSRQSRATSTGPAFDTYFGNQTASRSLVSRGYASTTGRPSPLASSFYDEGAISRLHSDYADYNNERPLPPIQRPPIQRSYTPRTESTSELLGHFPDLQLPTNLPYATSHSRASSIFNCRKGFVAVDSSDDYATSSGRQTPQTDKGSGFKWHSQRSAKPRLKAKRRHSKADELLGFAEAPSRASSIKSAKNPFGEIADGKKSVMNLLKFSTLRRKSKD